MMIISNEEIKFKIYNSIKLNRETELTETDLKKVKSISLNKKDIHFRQIEFFKEDFEFLKYVETLTLNSFEITNEIIEGLQKIINLKFLILNHCNFTGNMLIDNNLEKIIINYPHNLNLNLFFNISNIKMIELINVKQIDVRELLRFKYLRKVSIYNSNIIFFEKLKNLKELQELNLDGSNKVDEICNNLLKRNIKIHYSDEYLPF